MHNTDFSEQVVARAIKRRGKLHPYDSLDAGKTAVVVVDMQNGFLAEGSILEVPIAREIVPNINAITKAARAAGSLVVWIQMTIRDRADWPNFLGSVVPDNGSVDRVLSTLQPGTEGQKLWPRMEVDTTRDIAIEKNRFSAFLPTSSPIAQVLRDRGIDTVIITGTLTNVCCESSARDAMMQDFKVTMVSDANAALTDEAHMATLSTFIQSFGDVRSTADVIRMLGGETA